MAVSKAQQKAVNKYIKGNYDRLNVTIAKGAKAIISDYAASQGKSTNGLVNELLEAEIPALKDIKRSEAE